MDVNRVIGEVAARHGVRLDPDDPALVLVTVAEMMLAEAREEFLASARRATAEFVDAAGRVQEVVGNSISESKTCAFVGQPTEPVGVNVRGRCPPFAWPDSTFRTVKWRNVLVVIIAVLAFGVGLLAGRRCSPCD